MKRGQPSYWLPAASRRPALIGCVVLALATLSQGALAATERLSIIANNEIIGYVSAEVVDGRTIVDYLVNDNGRGPRHKEEIRLGPGGVPVEWTINGTSLMGGPVKESFRWANGQANWSSQAETGTVAVDRPALYIVNDDSPWADGVYARAALAAGGMLPVLPGGELRVTQLRQLVVKGESIIIYRLDGIAIAPSYVALGHDKRLFAAFGPTHAAISAGSEDEAPRFLALGTELERERIRQISVATGHRFTQPVRIRNVHVFDPLSGTRGPTSTIVVLNGRITQVVVGAADPAVTDQVLIDGDGGTIYPGLHDMHSHSSLDSGLYYLAAGVTETRDMGNDNAFLLDLMPRIGTGEIAGPHIVPSGFIEGRGAFSARDGIVVDSLDAALQAVRWYAERGYREIKIYNSFNPAWVASTAAEAHRLGLGVTGHVPAFATADSVIHDGYDTIAHINQLMLGWLLKPGEDTRSALRLTAMARAAELDLNAPQVRRTVALMKKKGTALDTTAMILERLMLSRAGQVTEADAPYLSHMPVGYQRYRKRTFVTIANPAEDARYRKAFDRLVDTMRMLRREGIRLLPGTDDGLGISVHRELELYVRAGMTPAEALRAGTLDAAVYLGQDHDRGTIVRGKLADMVLVAGDPTRDISEARRPRMVMAGGAVYFPAEIYRALGIRPFAEPPRMTLPIPKPEHPDVSQALIQPASNSAGAVPSVH